MKITMESTTVTTEINGVPARVWEGYTESGIPCHAYITRIAVDVDEAQEQFEAELQECRPPQNPDLDAIPHRLVL